MEKIAVFGGTFDPVQTEHVNLVKNAIKQLNLNKLIVMPDNIPPHKQGKEITPTGDRLQMCRLAFGNIDCVEVSDYEINKGGNSYSYITMEHFREEYPTAELYFIVGTDMLKSFPQWKNPERILACCDLIYCEREGEKDSENAYQTFIEKYGENKIVKLDYIGKNLSATKVRVYTKLGLNIDGLVCGEVKDYIYANNLYQGDKYYNYVKNELPEKRLLHTAGVILTATKFAERLNVDVEKAELSALLHDVAKYKNVADYKDCPLPENTPKSCEHQYLGAYIVEKELGIKDDEIINAVRYHTTGRKGMTLIEKIIYLADLIEPSRTFDGVDEIRKKTDENFEEGFKFALKEILKFIKKNSGELDLKTVEAVEYYCGKGE